MSDTPSTPGLPGLGDTDPNLLDVLHDLGDLYGPAGVRRTAAALWPDALGPIVVTVAIGNSDDRLSQAEWAAYRHSVDRAVRGATDTIYGAWVSPSADPWQNAAWSFEVVDPDVRDALRRELTFVARAAGQHSIAWTEGHTTFITGRPTPATDPTQEG